MGLHKQSKTYLHQFTLADMETHKHKKITWPPCFARSRKLASETLRFFAASNTVNCVFDSLGPSAAAAVGRDRERERVVCDKVSK